MNKCASTGWLPVEWMWSKSYGMWWRNWADSQDYLIQLGYLYIYIYIYSWISIFFIFIDIYIDILIYYSYRYRMTGYVGMYNQPTQNVVQRRACRNMQLEYTLASVFFMTWWMVPWRICPSFSLVIPNCCCLLLAFQDPDYSCIVEKTCRIYMYLLWDSMDYTFYCWIKHGNDIFHDFPLFP